MCCLIRCIMCLKSIVLSLDNTVLPTFLRRGKNKKENTRISGLSSCEKGPFSNIQGFGVCSCVGLIQSFYRVRVPVCFKEFSMHRVIKPICRLPFIPDEAEQGKWEGGGFWKNRKPKNKKMKFRPVFVCRPALYFLLPSLAVQPFPLTICTSYIIFFYFLIFTGFLNFIFKPDSEYTESTKSTM